MFFSIVSLQSAIHSEEDKIFTALIRIINITYENKSTFSKLNCYVNYWSLISKNRAD